MHTLTIRPEKGGGHVLGEGVLWAVNIETSHIFVRFKCCRLSSCFLVDIVVDKNSIIWPDKLEQTFEILCYLLSLDTKPLRLMNTPIARVVKLSFLDKQKHNNNFIIRYIQYISIELEQQE